MVHKLIARQLGALKDNEINEVIVDDLLELRLVEHAHQEADNQNGNAANTPAKDPDQLGFSKVEPATEITECKRSAFLRS